MGCELEKRQGDPPQQGALLSCAKEQHEKGFELEPGLLAIQILRD